MFNKKAYMKEYRQKNKDKIREQRKEYHKEYYKNNRDEMIKKSKQWKKNHPDYIKEYHNNHPEKLYEYNKRYRENNPEKIKEMGRQYYENNREKIKKRKKLWRENNREKTIEISKRWQKNNPGIVREMKKQYCKNKYKIDLKFNLNCRIVTAIYHSLKGNKSGRRWEDLVGYTLEDLIIHLKKTMPKGYTWQDFIQGKLHIDHKIPISVFNYTKPEHADFKRCWNLSNLRLLPAKENLIKNDKLTKPFQPALAF